MASQLNPSRGKGRLSDMADPNKLRDLLNDLLPDGTAKTRGFWDAFGESFARSAPNAVPTQKLLEVIGHVLEFEKLSPASTKQRLHNYVLRNYTEGGRRIVYRRAKRLQTMPPVPYNANFYESALRAVQGVDRRCKLKPEQVSEMRQVYDAGEASMRQLANRFGVSVSTVSNIINGRYWKD